ncbi:ankyrin repeat domain-containing protein [Luteimonas aquatica]|uniref:ankyrin repeat domain-containing protein n=1 Tax=Luteimonas aquatica TaxID=450364 RepID=UPI001F596DB2|nr:ankyrin repeat domain-containing protein [Luteimonas aquatica]
MSSKPFTDPSTASLAEAAKDGDAVKVRELVAAGANPNAESENGLPLLQWAMLNQSRTGFEALLAAGADPTRGDSDGDTAVHLAAQADTPYWLETLLKRGISPDTPNTKTQATPMMSALMSERSGNADLLMKSGAQLDAVDRQGNAAIHVAAKINETGRILKLLEAGANPNLKNARGSNFQRYLFMTPENVLNGETRRQREAIKDWLRAHNIPVEDAG